MHANLEGVWFFRYNTVQVCQLIPGPRVQTVLLDWNKEATEPILSKPRGGKAC